ncbi:fimbria/pilus periplasmic chaperone [Cupriavidus sp. CuC1]|uniref:fimbria/pilus periplasmic chaperone n=1 Tax=Cupriavidus sp. CuC1 TaxID=3373131 RepID=UPI0037D440E8
MTKPMSPGRNNRWLHYLRPWRGIGGALALMLALAPAGTQAALSITGTRFIYPASMSDLSVSLRNAGDSPILVQAWLDKGDVNVDPARLSVPFILSPPLLRLDPERKTVLRVRYTGEPLPEDRESVFWINFLEVPPLAEDSTNLLRLSYRTRMKLLFRPSGLPGNADEAIPQVTWAFGKAETAGGAILEATNPTPFHVSLARMEVGRGGASVELEGQTIVPLGVTRFTLPGLKGSAADEAVIHYEAVKDSGELIVGSSTVTR